MAESAVHGILIVDNDVEEIRSLQEVMKKVIPDYRVFAATTSALAEFYMDVYDVSIALIDTNADGATGEGIRLAQKLIRLNDSLNVIFLADDAEDVLAAIKVRPSGFLVRPVRSKDIEEEVNHLKYPIAEGHRRKHTPVLQAHCFGRFTVSCDGNPIAFQRSAEMEIMAYLIDRMGKGVTKEDIALALWPDVEMRKKRKNYLRVLISGLFNTIRIYHIDQAFVRMRDYYAVRPDYIACDYYDYLEGDHDAIKSYNGEYMSQYAWAKKTCRIKAQTPDKILAM